MRISLRFVLKEFCSTDYEGIVHKDKRNITIAMFSYLMKKKFELGVLIVLIALLVGLFDQVQINDMKELTSQYHNWQSLYSDFYGKVEDDLPEGAMIYQLPFMG